MTPCLRFAPFPRKACPTRKALLKSAGFTLVELMIVVVIMGVLATIGIASFRREVHLSKSREAYAMIESIAIAQEKFKTHHPSYLNVSTSLTTYYPAATVGSIIRPFWGWVDHVDYDNWVRLDPKAPLEIRYVFATTAGMPYTEPSALTEGSVAGYDWPDPLTIHNPWYVVQAIGDLNDNGENHLLLLTSFTDTVYEEGSE
jgi:prepilin-type N-terminal cleavage/methylation domain-containing protein